MKQNVLRLRMLLSHIFECICIKMIMLSGRAIVGALASHQWDAASTPRINITCRLSLLVLYFTLGGFPQEVRFSPLLKNVHLILFGFSIYSRPTLAPKVAVFLGDLRRL